jgi:hypothetical protein
VLGEGGRVFFLNSDRMDPLRRLPFSSLSSFKLCDDVMQLFTFFCSFKAALISFPDIPFHDGRRILSGFLN